MTEWRFEPRVSQTLGQPTNYKTTLALITLLNGIESWVDGEGQRKNTARDLMRQACCPSWESRKADQEAPLGKPRKRLSSQGDEGGGKQASTQAFAAKRL